MGDKSLLVLMSSLQSSRKQISEQSRAMMIINSRKIPHTVIDAMDKKQNLRRTQLFNISGVRGQYPQFFLLEKLNKTTYVGGFDSLEAINENSSLPKAILDKNPAIRTWESFLDVQVPPVTKIEARSDQETEILKSSGHRDSAEEVPDVPTLSEERKRKHEQHCEIVKTDRIDTSARPVQEHKPYVDKDDGMNHCTGDTRVNHSDTDEAVQEFVDSALILTSRLLKRANQNSF